jgi:hypothetical protein
MDFLGVHFANENGLSKNATFLTQNQDFGQKSKKPNQKNYFCRLKKGADQTN